MEWTKALAGGMRGLAFALMIVLSACHPVDEYDVPVELAGLWRSSSPEYKDRYLEIRDGLIFIGTGEIVDQMYFIVKIEEEPRGGERLFTIYYEDMSRMKQYISFYYNPSDGGTIRLKNQKQMIWKKDRDFGDA